MHDLEKDELVQRCKQFVDEAYASLANADSAIEIYLSRVAGILKNIYNFDVAISYAPDDGSAYIQFADLDEKIEVVGSDDYLEMITANWFKLEILEDGFTLNRPF